MLLLKFQKYIGITDILSLIIHSYNKIENANYIFFYNFHNFMINPNLYIKILYNFINCLYVQKETV